jgi:hypothetical protein
VIRPDFKLIIEAAGQMGIKLEELLDKKDFLNLNIAKQKLVLDTLKQSAFYRIKAESQDAVNQKISQGNIFKKGWLNFGKGNFVKRTEIAGIQNLKKHGLAAYGEQEFSDIIKALKDTPDGWISSRGEVKVDYLNDFENKISADDLTNKDYDIKKAIEIYELTANLLATYTGTTDNRKEAATRDNLKHNLIQTRAEILKNLERSPKYQDAIAIFLNAEKNIRLNQFLSGDKQAGKSMDKLLRDNEDNQFKQKALAFIQGYGDKISYTAIGVGGRLALTFAIGWAGTPIIATGIGAFRGRIQAEKELKTRNELAQRGIADNSASAKNLEIAVGKKSGQASDKQINIGLAEKLDSLVEKINNLLAQDKIEDLSDEEEEQLQILTHRLEDRLIYTENRMNDNLVLYGDVTNRSANFMALLDSLASAHSSLMTSSMMTNGSNLSEQSKKIKEIISSTGQVTEERLALSVQDRLTSFMVNRENKRQVAAEKYLVKKTLQGAAIALGFSSVASLVTGIFKVNGSNNISELMTAQTKRLADLTKNMTANHNLGAAAIHETLTKTTDPKPIEALSRIISHETSSGHHDSIWRSTRELFKAQAHNMGYKGDLNNTETLNRWAETQTANAIHHSNQLPDKVFAGDKIILDHGNHGYQIKVETGHEHLIAHSLTGHKPTLSQPTSPSSYLPVDKHGLNTDLINHHSLSMAANPTGLDQLANNSANQVNPFPTEVVGDKIKIFDINNFRNQTTSFNNTPHGLEQLQHFIEQQKKWLPTNGIVETASKGWAIKTPENYFLIGRTEITLNPELHNSMSAEFLKDEQHGVQVLKFLKDRGLDKALRNWHTLGEKDQLIYKAIDDLHHSHHTDSLANFIDHVFKGHKNEISINTDKNQLLVRDIKDHFHKLPLSFAGIQKALKLLQLH